MQKGRVKSNGFGGHRLFCVKYACIELEIEEVSDDIMSDVIRSTYKPQCKDLLRRQVWLQAKAGKGRPGAACMIEVMSLVPYTTSTCSTTE